jgi:hypothetical protein
MSTIKPSPTSSSTSTSTPSTLHESYGDLVPYGDQSWYQQYHTPYYNNSHVRFRNAMREWVEEHLIPYISEWSESNVIPKSLFKQASQAGWLPGCLGNEWPTEYIGDHIIGGIKATQYDAFHNYILHDELGRIAAGGIVGGLSGGLTIGVSVLLIVNTLFLLNTIHTNKHDTVTVTVNVHIYHYQYHGCS